MKKFYATFLVALLSAAVYAAPANKSDSRDDDDMGLRTLFGDDSDSKMENSNSKRKYASKEEKRNARLKRRADRRAEKARLARSDDRRSEDERSSKEEKRPEKVDWGDLENKKKENEQSLDKIKDALKVLEADHKTEKKKLQDALEELRTNYQTKKKKLENAKRELEQRDAKIEGAQEVLKATEGVQTPSRRPRDKDGRLGF